MKNNLRIETEQAVNMISSLTFLAEFAIEANADFDLEVYADVFELINELSTAIKENEKDGDVA